MRSFAYEYESTFRLLLTQNEFICLASKHFGEDLTELDKLLKQKSCRESCILHYKNGLRFYEQSLQQKVTQERVQKMKLVPHAGTYYTVPLVRRCSVEYHDVRAKLRNDHELLAPVQIVQRLLLRFDAKLGIRLCLERHSSEYGLQYLFTGEVEYPEHVWNDAVQQDALEMKMFRETLKLFGQFPLPTADLLRPCDILDVPSRAWTPHLDATNELTNKPYAMTYKLDGCRGRIAYNTNIVQYYDDLNTYETIDCPWFHQFPNIVFQVEILDNIIVITDIIGAYVVSPSTNFMTELYDTAAISNSGGSYSLYMFEPLSALNALFAMRQSIRQYTVTVRRHKYQLDAQQPIKQVPVEWCHRFKIHFDGFILTSSTNIYKLKAPTIDARLDPNGYMYVQGKPEPVCMKNFKLEKTEQLQFSVNEHGQKLAIKSLSTTVAAAGTANLQHTRRANLQHTRRANSTNAMYVGSNKAHGDTVAKTGRTQVEEANQDINNMALEPNNIYELSIDFKRCTVDHHEYVVLRKRYDRQHASSLQQYAEFLKSVYRVLRVILYMNQSTEKLQGPLWFNTPPATDLLTTLIRTCLVTEPRSDNAAKLPAPQPTTAGHTITEYDVHAQQKQRLRQSIEQKLVDNKITPASLKRFVERQYKWLGDYFMQYVKVFAFIDLLNQTEWQPLKVFLCTGSTEFMALAGLEERQQFLDRLDLNDFYEHVNVLRSGHCDQPDMYGISCWSSNEAPQQAQRRAAKTNSYQRVEQSSILYIDQKRIDALTLENRGGGTASAATHSNRSSANSDFFNSHVFCFLDLYNSGATEYLLATMHTYPVYGVQSLPTSGPSTVTSAAEKVFYLDDDPSIKMFNFKNYWDLMYQLAHVPHVLGQVVRTVLEQYNKFGLGFVVIAFDGVPPPTNTAATVGNLSSNEAANNNSSSSSGGGIAAAGKLNLNNLLVAHAFLALQTVQAMGTIMLRITHMNEFVHEILTLLSMAFERCTLVRSNVTTNEHEFYFVGQFKHPSGWTIVSQKLYDIRNLLILQKTNNTTLIPNQRPATKTTSNEQATAAALVATQAVQQVLGNGQTNTLWFESPVTVRRREVLLERVRELYRLDVDTLNKRLNYDQPEFQFYDATILRSHYINEWFLNSHYRHWYLMRTNGRNDEWSHRNHQQQQQQQQHKQYPWSRSGGKMITNAHGCGGGGGGSSVDLSGSIGCELGTMDYNRPKLYERYMQNYSFGEDRSTVFAYYNRYGENLKHCHLLKYPNDGDTNLFLIIRSVDCVDRLSGQLQFNHHQQYRYQQYFDDNSGNNLSSSSSSVSSATDHHNHHQSQFADDMYMLNMTTRIECAAPVEFRRLGESFILLALWSPRQRHLRVVDAAYIMNRYIDTEPLLVRRRLCEAFVALTSAALARAQSPTSTIPLTVSTHPMESFLEFSQPTTVHSDDEHDTAEVAAAAATSTIGKSARMMTTSSGLVNNWNYDGVAIAFDEFNINGVSCGREPDTAAAQMTDGRTTTAAIHSARYQFGEHQQLYGINNGPFGGNTVTRRVDKPFWVLITQKCIITSR